MSNVQFTSTPDGVAIGGMKSNLDYIKIIRGGLDCVASLGEVDL